MASRSALAALRRPSLTPLGAAEHRNRRLCGCSTPYCWNPGFPPWFARRRGRTVACSPFAARRSVSPRRELVDGAATTRTDRHGDLVLQEAKEGGSPHTNRKAIRMLNVVL